MNIRKTFLTLTLLMFLSGEIPVLAQRAKNDAEKLSDLEQIGKRNINKGFANINFTSIAAESAMGAQAAAEFERNSILVSDPLIKDYIDHVGQTIAKNSDSPFPISIKVIPSQELNAFALPGGFIYINSGAIRVLDNEAELAFLIAQMVGHVAARHVTENNAKGTLMQSLALSQTPQSNSSAVPIGMFQFSKVDVKEADILGLEYMFKAGYDPLAAVSFFKKAQLLETTVKKSNPPLDAPPPIADRIAVTEKNIKTLLPARSENRLNTPEFEAAKARITN